MVLSTLTPRAVARIGPGGRDEVSTMSQKSHWLPGDERLGEVTKGGFCVKWQMAWREGQIPLAIHQKSLNKGYRYGTASRALSLARMPKIDSA